MSVRQQSRLIEHFVRAVDAEDLGVGRPLDSHAGAGAVQPHRANHRRGRAGHDRAAAGASLSRRLVEEDQPSRIEFSFKFSEIAPRYLLPCR